MFEDKNLVQDSEEIDGRSREVFVAAGTTTYAMTVRTRVVRVALTAITGACTVTLPSVADAKGKIYVVTDEGGAGGAAVTIEDKANDAGLTDITLDAAGESAILLSDGRCWWNLSNNV